MRDERSAGDAGGGPLHGGAAPAAGSGGARPSPALEPGGAAAPLAALATPRPSRRCAWQVVESEAVLLDLEGRRIQGLNAVGSFVWGLLDGVRTVAGLGREVPARFDVDVGRAEADVAAFLGELRRRGLVEVD
jgi:Coenzyme PQQ synthesis protein D (PqqD)